MMIKTRFSRSRCFAALALLCFLCLMVFGIAFITDSDILGVALKSSANEMANDLPIASASAPINIIRDETKLGLKSGISSSEDQQNNDVKQGLSRGDAVTEDVKYPPPNYDVHLFYYPWYGSPAVDGKYLHWNHRYLQHWVQKEAAKWPNGQHQPPDDIGSNYYPRLGPYSSRDPAVLDDHMRQIRSTGAGVLAVSWYPPGTSDDEGENLDSLFPIILDHADKYSLKVCVHVEPYKNRNHKNLRENIEYIVNKYGNHSAFYRRLHPSGRRLPLYYMYDSYQIPDEEWKAIFLPGSSSTVRNTNIDGIFVGLLVEKRHATALASSGFDGFYTYFASNGFTFGSNIHNWAFLSDFAKQNNILFVPSVGPGYIDERVRPWNFANTKTRKNGDYYEHSFGAAINVAPPIISITSFNEWHEGTQIEEAIPKKTEDFKYLDYEPHGSQYYLMLTRKWVFKFKRRLGIDNSKVL